MVEKIKAKNANGFYSKLLDKIIIVANERIKSTDVLRTIFHENMHAFFYSRYRSLDYDEALLEIDNFAMSFIKTINNAVEDIFGKDYLDDINVHSKDAKEEYPVHVVTKAMAENSLARLMDSMDGWQKRFVEDFINEIGYDTERETGERNDSGREGILEEVLVGSEEGRRRGEGDSIVRKRLAAERVAEKLGVVSLQ